MNSLWSALTSATNLPLILNFYEQERRPGTKETVLARHPIQSFLPGEATPEMSHRIGLELCKKILKDEYEFVLSTHIDKGHIHNHIIFSNVPSSRHLQNLLYTL